MARARLLKPGFFSNETLTEIHPFGRLLFAGLWTIADKRGRMNDRPKWIKGALFPYESVNVDKLLGELEGAGFIMRYEIEGERYIQIVNFEKHQHVHKNEVESEIPSPFGPVASLALVRTTPSNGDTDTTKIETAPAEANSTPKAEAKAEAEATSPVPSKRERLKAKLSLTDDEWKTLYAKHPGVNVNARYWEFLDWIGESEEKRSPTRGTFAAFDGFLMPKNGRSNSAAAAR